jgi:RNA polymerase sigma factor (sigma-70 family)
LRINTDISDADLLADYHRSGNAAILGELHRRYATLIFSVAMKYVKNSADAEEVVMEIYEKLHHGLKKELDRGEGILNFRSWLHVVVKNHCLMQLRKAGLTVDFPEILPNPPNDDEGLAEKEVKEVLLQNLESALKDLKPEQRLCLDLFFLQEKSYKQIATETGLAFNDIKTHLQNGKLNLRKALTKNRIP